MQIPDHEDGLTIAAGALGVDRDEVESMIRCDRLHQALLEPLACVNGVPLCRTRGEVLAALFVACARGGILPRRNVRFGWMMVLRAAQMSGYGWRRKSGDQDRLRSFGEQIEEGVDPGRELVEWLEARIRPGTPPEPPIRPVHVSSPLGSLRKGEMAPWANAADEGLRRFLQESCGPAGGRTIRPQIYDARGDTEEEIRANARRLLRLRRLDRPRPLRQLRRCARAGLLPARACSDAVPPPV